MPDIEYVTKELHDESIRRIDDENDRQNAHINGKEHSLGNYATKEEAVIAREKGEKIYHNPILEGAT